LEFLQWVKRFWDQYYPGGEPYDAIGRRGGAGLAAPTTTARGPVRPAVRPTAVSRSTPVATAVSHRIDPVRSRTPNSGAAAASGRELQELRNRAAQSEETIRGLEKERDFYFNKLRDIEILVQQFATEIEEKSRTMGLPLVEECDLLVKEIQQILYSTEVLFLFVPTDLRRDSRYPLTRAWSLLMIMKHFNVIHGIVQLYVGVARVVMLHF
jgi:microtubule-associated protein, RP/EB family